jgi:DNA processing protein
MSDISDLTDEYWTDERRARLALNRVVEAGTPIIGDYVDWHGAEDTWERVKNWSLDDRPWAQRAAGINIDRLIEQMDALQGIRFIIPGDPEWRDELQFSGLHSRVLDGRGGTPVGLWVMGPGDLLCKPSVAIVGSRSSTRYGEIVATEMAHDLAEQGRTIISGGAYGIDACAHRGALAADGFTIGVYAQGLDNAYPRGNTGLYERLASEHLVVSEAPPGTPPSRYGFIARNRLIAALAQATVVVEAAERSGARNTASWAQELGRAVMAVPGPVTAATSVTPNRLIQYGQAQLVSNAADVITVMEKTTPAVELAQVSITRDDLTLTQPVPTDVSPDASVLVLQDSLDTLWSDTNPGMEPQHEKGLGYAFRNVDNQFDEQPGLDTRDAESDPTYELSHISP